jgi:alkanesulfonate monooxygenase SsuD/methylene tetrahydromethanopterin reductase-like flavin-dependent oxidoreductase (luciferase family)
VDTTRKRLAVAAMPMENRREALMTLAEAADQAGYDGFFLPETWAFDVTVLLAEAAVRTRRIQVGSSILPVWSRSPGALAMAAATLASISGGRFVLGLGASTPQLSEGLHDVPFATPLARMRRAVTQVRALLQGERVPLAVTTSARPLKLNVPSFPPVPIYLAALADASVRLAGELADGWLPFLYPRSCLGRGRELLAEGAARSGAPERRIVVAASIPTVVDADPAQARAGAAWFVSLYLTTMGSLYRERLVRFGFGKEVEAVLAANSPKLQSVVPPEAEVLLEELTVFGTPPEARARLERWYAAGVDYPGLLLRPHLTPAQIELTLDTFRPKEDTTATRRS